MTRLIRALAGAVWDALADACLTDGRGGSVLDGMRLTAPPPIEVTINVDVSGFNDAMSRLTRDGIAREGGIARGLGARPW